MKYRLLDLLCCPYDRHYPLSLSVQKKIEEKVPNPLDRRSYPGCKLSCGFHEREISQEGDTFWYKCEKCMNLDITTGHLACPVCNREFPIIEGIPSFLPDELKDDNDSSSLNPKDILLKRKEMEVRSEDALKKYQRDKMTAFIKSMETGLLLKRLQSTKVNLLLDLGAGTGDTAFKYKHCARESVFADYSRGPLLVLSARLKEEKITNVYPIQIDASLMPFREGVFDLIISLQMIHHMPSEEQRENTLRNSYYVLRREGYFFVTVYNDHLMNKVNRWFKVNGYQHRAMKGGYHANGIYYHNFSYSEWAKMLKRHFVLEELVGVAPIIPKITRYSMQSKEFGEIVNLCLEKGGVSTLFGRLLLAKVRKG